MAPEIAEACSVSTLRRCTVLFILLWPSETWSAHKPLVFLLRWNDPVILSLNSVSDLGLGRRKVSPFTKLKESNAKPCLIPTVLEVKLWFRAKIRYSRENPLGEFIEISAEGRKKGTFPGLSANLVPKKVEWNKDFSAILEENCNSVEKGVAGFVG